MSTFLSSSYTPFGLVSDFDRTDALYSDAFNYIPFIPGDVFQKCWRRVWYGDLPHSQGIEERTDGLFHGPPARMVSLCGEQWEFCYVLDTL